MAIDGPKEDLEQRWVFQWARMNYPTKPELKLLLHVPNGGYRLKSEAARMHGMGVKAGVPDLLLPVARGKYHGLWIEMKRAKGGKVSAAQQGMIGALRAQDYAVCVCYGWVAAVQTIEGYLETGEVPGEEVHPRELVYR